MSVPVTVKWGKENYDVNVDTTEAPTVFKFQMYSLTGVQPERQKIMIKGSTLKDDSDWAKLALKPGQKLMMMGTADKVITKNSLTRLGSSTRFALVNTIFICIETQRTTCNMVKCFWLVHLLAH